MNINHYLTRRGKTIYLDEKNFKELGWALGLGRRGELRIALRVMRRIHNGKLRSPDTRLMGVIPPPYTRVNLTKLHRLVNAPFFEWSYSRYYRATPRRLETIKRFDRILTELGVFD
jgi:hypothetical protein